MSYHYGLNGNDLNWDAMPYHFECIECERYVEELKEFYGEQEFDLHANGEQDCEEGCGCELCDYFDNLDIGCDGHTIIYKIGKVEVYHDTNGNFVTIAGNRYNIAGIFRDDYLMDWIKAEGSWMDADDLDKLIQELKERRIETIIKEVDGDYEFEFKHVAGNMWEAL